MSDTSKYHLPHGTSADGSYDLVVTPESAGWGYSGLRILTLRPGQAHALSTGESWVTDPRLPFGAKETE